MNDVDEIRALLATINDAWLHGTPDGLHATLGDCFEDDMLIAGPNFQRMSRGKGPCIDSYADFMRQARILECRLGEPIIDLRGDTAVATYSWEMTYELDGRTYRESGSDVMVLRRTDKWRATWRAVVPNPQQ